MTEDERADEENGSTGDELDTTTQAIHVYLASQNEGDGTIAGIGYWQIGNGYTAMALHEQWSRTSTFTDGMRRAFARIAADPAHRGFINEFNDDSMWWALASLELFGLTGEPAHLAPAHAVWAHVRRSRISRPGQVVFRGRVDMLGAVHWTSRAGETRLNTITTGLFAELSARLAVQYAERGAEMLDLAVGSLAWIRHCRFDRRRLLVLDTIDYAGAGEEIDWTFTYTTGQAIAASTAIYAASLQRKEEGDGDGDGDGEWDDNLAFARDLAVAAMRNAAWVDADGTLAATGEYPGRDRGVWDNDDAVGFKAILLRSLAKLLRLLQQTRREEGVQADLRTFIRRQFASLTARDTNGRGQYGPYWAGPFEAPTSHSQLAALDVMAAVHAC